MFSSDFILEQYVMLNAINWWEDVEEDEGDETHKDRNEDDITDKNENEYDFYPDNEI